MNTRITLNKNVLKDKKIVIVGGGLTGCLSAILLKKLRAKVTILEKAPLLFSGASSWSWGRFHFGQHSIDALTEQSISERHWLQKLQQIDTKLFSFLAPFILKPGEFERPEYYLSQQEWNERNTPSCLSWLTESFNRYKEQLSIKEKEQLEQLGDYFTQANGDCFEENYRNSLKGISTNEAPINLAKLAAAIIEQLKVHDIEYKTSIEVEHINPIKNDNNITYQITVNQGAQAYEADYVINAAWSAGPQLDPTAEPGTSIRHRLIYYLVVEGVENIKPGSYISVLGANQINFFHIGNGKAVLEVQNISSPKPHREQSNREFIDLDVSDSERTQEIFNFCQSRMPSILSSSARPLEGFYAEFWNQDNGARASDQVTTEPYRFQKDGFYALSSAKITLAIESVLSAISDIYWNNLSAQERDLIDKNRLKQVLKEQIELNSHLNPHQVLELLNFEKRSMSVLKLHAQMLLPSSGLSLHEIGLSFQKVPGDGSCFYHAVALYLGQDQQQLRNDIANYVEANRAEYEEFIDLTPGQTFEDYVHQIRVGEAWADHVEINTLMRLLNQPILVVNPQGNITNLDDAARYNGDPIFVYYNGVDHYDALIRNADRTGREVLNAFQTTIDNVHPSVSSSAKLIGRFGIHEQVKWEPRCEISLYLEEENTINEMLGDPYASAGYDASYKLYVSFYVADKEGKFTCINSYSSKNWKLYSLASFLKEDSRYEYEGTYHRSITITKSGRISTRFLIEYLKEFQPGVSISFDKQEWHEIAENQQIIGDFIMHVISNPSAALEHMQKNATASYR